MLKGKIKWADSLAASKASLHVTKHLRLSDLIREKRAHFDPANRISFDTRFIPSFHHD
jgi:hypothetical protein